MRLLFLAFLIIPCWLQGQTLVRTLISPAGEHFVSGNIDLSISVGDPSSVVYYEENCFSYSTGFQQADEIVPCYGDLNHDHVVNITDLLMISSEFGSTGVCLDGDLDQNLAVNIIDYLIFSGYFGETCD